MRKADNQIEYEAAVWAEYAAMAGVPDEHGPDGEWFMEAVVVITVRDDLPAAAAAHPTALEADRRIFSQREKLLPYFRDAYRIRAEENPPKSAWWWWLDEIVAGTYTEALPEYLSE